MQISDAGRRLIAELRQAREDRLTLLLETLSTEDRATLSLAMYIALPLIQRLTQHAAAGQRPRRDHTSLTT